MWHTILLFSTTLVAAFVQTTAGFAFAIIIMSIWPLFLPVVEATQLMMFGSAVSIITMAIRHRRHINFRIVVVPSVLGLAGTFVGASALVSVQNDTAVKVFGVVLVLLAVYLIFFSDRVRIPRNVWSASIAGAISGLMGGFLNIPGPPVVLYYSVATDSKEEYLGTLQFFFAVILVFKIAFLWIQRGLSRFVVQNVPIVVIASAIGLLIGIHLFKSMSTKSLRIMIYVLMIASGIWYVIR